MEDDRSFYERRLNEELARAGAHRDEGLRALHRRWALLYRERLAGLRTRSPPSGQAGAGPDARPAFRTALSGQPAGASRRSAPDGSRVD